MDGSESTVWWMLAGVLVAVELATGTFYLLMLALGCAAGALAAHGGLGGTAQVIVAVIVGAGATTFWHLRRQRAPQPPEAAFNRDVNLDIGGTLQVDTWQADGMARASYRGAPWTVQFVGTGPPTPGEHVIQSVQGNRLQVVRSGTAQ